MLGNRRMEKNHGIGHQIVSARILVLESKP